MFNVTVDNGSTITTHKMGREEIAALLGSGGWWITSTYLGKTTYISMSYDYTVEID